MNADNEPQPFFYMAVALRNSFLHQGQFQKGQHIYLYHAGVSIAEAIVEEVLDPCLAYWDQGRLPCDVSQKIRFPEHQVSQILSDWTSSLSSYQISVGVDPETGQPYLTIHQLPHQTLLLFQAQQICEVIVKAPFESYYKISYEPPVYGMIDLFLKNFLLSFILTDSAHYTTGKIEVK